MRLIVCLLPVASIFLFPLSVLARSGLDYSYVQVGAVHATPSVTNKGIALDLSQSLPANFALTEGFARLTGGQQNETQGTLGLQYHFSLAPSLDLVFSADKVIARTHDTITAVSTTSGASAGLGIRYAFLPGWEGDLSAFDQRLSQMNYHGGRIQFLYTLTPGWSVGVSYGYQLQQHVAELALRYSLF